MAETQKEKIMRILDVTAEEADEIIAYDKEVDRTTDGLKYDIDKAVAKAALKEAHKGHDRKPTVYKFDKRERKANPTKGGIIAELAKFLTENSEYATENVEITNKERQIAFKIGEDAFELTLVQKRKPKN